IVAVKRAKEANLQFGVGGRINNLCNAASFFDLPGSFAASIEHTDLAVRSEAVVGSHAFAASLESLLVPGNLVPSAKVLLEVDRLCRFGSPRIPHRMAVEQPRARHRKQPDGGY